MFAADLPFKKRQLEANTRLQEKYLSETFGEGRKLVLDKLQEPVLWLKNAGDLLVMVRSLRQDPVFSIDFLSDLTAYDNEDGKDGKERFVVVYQLYSVTTQVRVRLKLRVDEHAAVPTLVGEWRGANWLEREVYDLFGIKFAGHPNLRRIMMDERFTGHPLRKDYDIKQREPFASNVPLHLGANELPKSQG